MKRSSLAAVIVVSVVIWAIAILHDFAQDKPSTSVVEDLHTVELVTSSNTAISSVIVITGKVHVVRDDVTYQVQEVCVVSDEGRIYKVLLEGAGKQLAKILKSKIIRVTGEIREGSDKPFLVVNDVEVIGSSKKIEALNSNKKAIPVKNPETNSDVKESISNISANVIYPTNMVVSPYTKPSTNADTVISPVSIPVSSTNS
ncbi:MAG: hypothetical protein A2283_19840 [Lentisphaerae bacterium RIFOXYA12_FULL_48_11]|nr:MAG: hypothetical protein A2283_19840 [Lentisphaerae bacterium RIFOXYA12_FULL_48_11]